MENTIKWIYTKMQNTKYFVKDKYNFLGNYYFNNYS